VVVFCGRPGCHAACGHSVLTHAQLVFVTCVPMAKPDAATMNELHREVLVMRALHAGARPAHVCQYHGLTCLDAGRLLCIVRKPYPATLAGRLLQGALPPAWAFCHLLGCHPVLQPSVCWHA
jgi:hypothetical protein